MIKNLPFCDGNGDITPIDLDVTIKDLVELKAKGKALADTPQAFWDFQVKAYVANGVSALLGVRRLGTGTEVGIWEMTHSSKYCQCRTLYVDALNALGELMDAYPDSELDYVWYDGYDTDTCGFRHLDGAESEQE